jgi:hypothetical protein
MPLADSHSTNFMFTSIYLKPNHLGKMKILLIALSITLLPFTLTAQSPVTKNELINSKVQDWSGLPSDFINGIDAVSDYDDDYALFFKGTKMFFYPLSSAAKDYPPIDLKTIENWPPNWDHINGAASWGSGTVVFNGDSFVVFNDSIQIVEIGSSSNLPWVDGVKAACRLNDDIVLLMNGLQFIEHGSKPESETVIYSIEKWPGWKTSGWNAIDAALKISANDPILYFFRGNKCLAYNTEKHKIVDDFPKQISLNPETQPTPAVTKSAALYTDEYVENKNIDGTMMAATSIISSSWLGAGFDIAYVDPLDYVQHKKISKPIYLTFSSQPSSDGKNLLHYGTDFSTTSTLSQDLQTVNTLNTVSMRNTFNNKKNISGAAGIEGYGFGADVSFSASKTFENARATSSTGENMTIIGMLSRQMQQYSLKLVWSPKEFEKSIEVAKGVRFRQRIDPDLRYEIESLPTDSNDLTSYRNLIFKWGTHFSSSVTFGGYCKSETVIEKKIYDNSDYEGAAFTAEASVAVKGRYAGIKGHVSVNGGFAENKTGENKSFESSVNSRTTLECRGGDSGGDDVGKWAAGVDNRPVPIDMEFQPIFSLVNAVFFPEDKDIAQKNYLLKKALAEYFTEVRFTYPDINAESVFFDKSKTLSAKEATKALLKHRQNSAGFYFDYGMTQNWKKSLE